MPILVDREEELRALDRAWENRPCLALVYGRRRIGKTFLITTWARLRRLPLIYLVANYEDPAPALRDLEEQLGSETGLKPRLDTLRPLAEALVKLSCRGQVVVLDEFQRLANAGIAQLLQEAWDRWGRECSPGGLLILTGSAIGTIERIALQGGAPLYGRACSQLRLGPLDFTRAYPFLREAENPPEAFTLYSIFGSSPHTLSLVDPRWGVEGNLKRLVLEAGAPLREEPLRLLESELREPSRYLAILEASVPGPVSVGKIAKRTGLPVTSIAPYARRLEDMGLLARVPLYVTRRSLYRVSDPFTAFWLRYVWSRWHLFEKGLTPPPQPGPDDIISHVSQVWQAEALSHAVNQLQSRGEEPRWWGALIHKNIELDGLIETNTGRTYIVEAKWAHLAPGDVASLLRSTASKIAATPLRRGLEQGQVTLLIYAIEAKEPTHPPPGGLGYEAVELHDIVEQARSTPIHMLGEEA